MFPQLIGPDCMNKIIESFKGKKVLVVGDVMLDQYVFSKVDRISPEAPVPIAKVVEEKYALGGAANVANNISSLGGSAYLVGLVGNDAAGKMIGDISLSKGIHSSLVAEEGGMTTKKIRIVGHSQQLLRIDYEQLPKAHERQKSELIEKASEYAAKCDLCIVSDYAKGVISKELVDAIKKSGKKLIVDPKPKNKGLYGGAYLITPNISEASAMCGMQIEEEADWETAGKRLSGELNSNVFLTLGQHGARLFELNGKSTHFPSVAREVYDVSGAGDTVVAAVSLAIASGTGLGEACRIANAAAGIKVGKFGTAPVTAQELENVV